MAHYIKYQLEDGLELLVETSTAPTGGVVKTSALGDAVTNAKQKFEDALEDIKRSAILMRRKFEDLQSDEVEVKFGLKATGEVGNFAISKVGVEANYEVTLKWKKPDWRNA